MAAAAAGSYVLLRRSPADDPPPAVAPAAAPQAGAPAPSPTRESALLPLSPPKAAAEKPAGYIEYPDGSSFPPLNGVQQAPKIVFHRLTPFAKVIGKTRDARGREWYVHENGVRSTTFVNAAGNVSYEIEKDTAPAALLPDEVGTGR